MMFVSSTARRRLLAPEVIQTSAMDCGPASLKCLLEGFHISVSYGRLREACQTDVDGTSIDTIEELAVQLGLDAEQIMAPVDHLLLPEAALLPALIVSRLPNGCTHFVVAWRRHGQFVQVMDPAVGRRWLPGRQFLGDIYVHTHAVAAAAWREWAGSEESLTVLRRRLEDLHVSNTTVTEMIAVACADPDWRSLAALDAATRTVTALVRSGGLQLRQQTGRVLHAFFTRAQNEIWGGPPLLPAPYWSVQPAPPEPDGEARLFLQGAVLVHVRGTLPKTQSLNAEQPSTRMSESTPLAPELSAALAEPPSQPGREVLHLLRADGLLAPTVLLASLACAASGVVIEALLLRGLFDLGRELGLGWQRLGAMGALLVFVGALLFLELFITTNVLRFGRRLEARLRMAFLEKIPRLDDRYFHSRLISDMAERSHLVHTLRLLPELGGQCIRIVCEILLATTGIIWLDPASTPLAILAAAFALGVPLAAQPLFIERDLRFRNHTGALSRFYLDALLGLVAVRTHGAERSVRREHERLLVEWARAGMGLQRAVVATEGIQSMVGFGLAAWLVFDHLARDGVTSGVLLLVYWALNIPSLGQDLALVARQYPTHRNVTLRLLEPLGAPEEAHEQASELVAESPLVDTLARSSPGVAITMNGVSVRAAGHTILEEINVIIEPGTHVALVGKSGAGKSSLVGLLLGWHRPATGEVVVDNQLLDGHGLERLRRETAWVDPTVQIWNRSLFDNLRYGIHCETVMPLGPVIEGAALRAVLEKLPDGLQTLLGEAGGLVSGGEGQRVRIARSLSRSEMRLVILDEPFRGLDREQRRALLARVREWWKESTLLCITHDIEETVTFDRVLVIEGGRIIEDGDPTALVAQPESRYRNMLDAEAAVREGLWSSRVWRRLWLQDGKLHEAERSTNRTSRLKPTRARSEIST